MDRNEKQINRPAFASVRHRLTLRLELQRSAIYLARMICAESTEALAARMQAYWKIWREAASTSDVIAQSTHSPLLSDA